MRPIDYSQEFTLKIFETVKKLIVFEIPDDSNFVVDNALEKIKSLGFEPTREFLLGLTDSFLETLTPEIKKCLLAYYLKHRTCLGF